MSKNGQKAQSFRDLIAWQRAMDLVVQCYELTNNFPPVERLGLAHEIRKSAVSIPSNVAEGNQRRTTPAYLSCVSIALGSQGELFTQLELARRLKFGSQDVRAAAMETCEEVGRLLYGLFQSLEHRGNAPRVSSYRVPHP